MNTTSSCEATWQAEFERLKRKFNMRYGPRHGPGWFRIFELYADKIFDAQGHYIRGIYSEWIPIGSPSPAAPPCSGGGALGIKPDFTYDLRSSLTIGGDSARVGRLINCAFRDSQLICELCGSVLSFKEDRECPKCKELPGAVHYRCIDRIGGD